MFTVEVQITQGGVERLIGIIKNGWGDEAYLGCYKDATDGGVYVDLDKTTLVDCDDLQSWVWNNGFEANWVNVIPFIEADEEECPFPPGWEGQG